MQYDPDDLMNMEISEQSSQTWPRATSGSILPPVRALDESTQRRQQPSGSAVACITDRRQTCIATSPEISIMTWTLPQSPSVVDQSLSFSSASTTLDTSTSLSKHDPGHLDESKQAYWTCSFEALSVGQSKSHLDLYYDRMVQAAQENLDNHLRKANRVDKQLEHFKGAVQKIEEIYDEAALQVKIREITVTAIKAARPVAPEVHKDDYLKVLMGDCPSISPISAGIKRPLGDLDDTGYDDISEMYSPPKRFGFGGGILSRTMQVTPPAHGFSAHYLGPQMTPEE
ncbi:uncharacterized protein L969DRAFT_90355 [Mixia osmundae IAM 14324]|nr:uncharacterized protein L969DRAFT_90355 [Mixia osmundae IAM 14324]KEI36822.1 hypothetical protein L969DRAFT_90355 [Mixia osmundae IAM 14324]